MARLGKNQSNTLSFRPFGESQYGKFLTVVEANLGRIALPCRNTLERTDHSRCSKAQSDLYRQCLAGHVVHDIEGCPETLNSGGPSLRRVGSQDRVSSGLAVERNGVTDW